MRAGVLRRNADFRRVWLGDAVSQAGTAVTALALLYIAVDVLQRFLPARAQRIARIVTLLFTAAICAAMAWYSIGLVSIDFAESSSAAAADALKAIPSWVLESILPVGFALMALRFVLRAFAPPAHSPELLHDPGAQPTQGEQL